MRWLLTLFAVGLGMVLPSAAIAGTEKPDYRYHGELRDVPVYVDTTSCPGFGPGELVLVGRIAWHYAHFADPTGDILGEDEGWADLAVETTTAEHSYRVHERYLFPRQFREFVFGWAHTRIERDDGTTLEGDAALTFNPQALRNEIFWLGTPTCSP